MLFRTFAFLTAVIVISFTLIFGPSAFAQEKMSMDQYRAQLSDWQQKQTEANKTLDGCSNDVERLKGELGTLQAQTQQVWQEILTTLNATQGDVDAYRNQLKGLESDVDGLLALSPEELFKKRAELQAAEAKLKELKQNKLSVLSEMQNEIATIEGKLTQLKNKMPKAIYDEYSVAVGDYLWRISGKADIYNNPMQWMRIYSYNVDQIKNPDLIYPKQVLKIQREVGPDEYLVAKGDYLAKIAAQPGVFGNASDWTKIYEKNKSIIGGNANTIYPYTVLVIPK